MRWIIFPLIAGMALAGVAATSQETVAKQPNRSDAGAATYEQLATAIIAIRKTEDTLVSEILNNYRQLADDHLRAAQDDAKDRVGHLEAAADEVTNIANEGNKSIQAIRQRLKQAGHSHHSDADTKEDYMFVDSHAKKDFLALAKKIAQLGADATPDQVAGVRKELDELFAKTMAAK
jgi:predicted  nucleic acid-binding Zn-ribbon protein